MDLGALAHEVSGLRAVTLHRSIIVALGVRDHFMMMRPIVVIWLT